MPDTTVRYYASTMPGAPTLSGTAGALIAVLDACLTTGFGSVTLDSLVVAANVATGTVSAGHNFAMTGTTGPVIRIEGATPAGLNGDWRVTVTGGTTFTFATSGISDQTASGTITAKRAPAGFSKAFSDTNKAVYQADDLASTRLYLRVYDAATTYATVKGYETMADVDTGTGGWPSAARYCLKSTTANSTARAWRLFADSRAFYLLVRTASDDYWDGHAWGDLVSFVPGDAYHVWLSANANNSSYGDTLFHRIGRTVQDADFARAASQAAGSVTAEKYTHNRVSALGAGGMNEYPCTADNGFYAAPVDVWEGAGLRPRGQAPGLYCPLHNSLPADATVISAIAQLSGRELFIQTVYNTGRAAFDLTGPWR